MGRRGLLLSVYFPELRPYESIALQHISRGHTAAAGPPSESGGGRLRGHGGRSSPSGPCPSRGGLGGRRAGGAARRSRSPADGDRCRGSGPHPALTAARLRGHWGRPLPSPSAPASRRPLLPGRGRGYPRPLPGGPTAAQWRRRCCAGCGRAGGAAEPRTPARGRAHSVGSRRQRRAAAAPGPGLWQAAAGMRREGGCGGR